ncbi:hypothetical protein MYX78_05720 [Acidobacteria bacterium AH-259-G07]|nr:hypothetical protein [Acidobacteria bacterium AH-259-G07]
MRTTRVLYQTMVAVGFALFWVSWPACTSAPQSSGEVVIIDDDDLGGVVTSPNGPEAGVWVIAETTDLPTRYARIVVTDQGGRYVLPASGS